MNKRFLGVLLVLQLSVTFGGSVVDPLDSLSILALGALDGRAVVKTADGKMHVLKLGSSIPGTKAVVTQILADKLVVEDSIDPSSEVRQTVWITKSSDSSGKAIVQRLNTEAPAQMAVVVEEAQAMGAGKTSKSTKKKTGDK